MHDGGSVGQLGRGVHGVGPEAAAISNTSGLVGVLRADALAEGSSEPLLPFAASVFVTRVKSVLALARLVALASLPVPEAFSVTIAARNGAVLLLALHLTLGVVPFASTSKGPAESLVGNEAARSGASVGGVGPHAVAVTVTFFLSEVLGRAAVDALAGVGVPGAVISASAGGLIGEDLAVADALGDGAVPHAGRVGIASRLVEVLVGAGDLAALTRKEAPSVLAVSLGKVFTARGSAVAAAVAFARGLSSHQRSAASAVDAADVAVTLERVVPLATVVGSAVSVGVGERADLVAAVGCVVPLTGVVLLTRGLGQIAVRALADAAGVTFRLAELVVEALLSGVDAFAGHDADVVDGVPHAAGFEVAIEGVGVFVLALELAGRVGIGEFVAALIVGLTFLPRTVVEFALLITSVAIIVPLAARVGIAGAFGLGAVETASREAVGGALRVRGVTRALPVAKCGFIGAFSVAVAVGALLVALGARPLAVVVGKAVALGESGAGLTARDLELRIVLAHGVFRALVLVEVPAVLTADVCLGVPHTLGVARASRLGGVAVAALTFAGAVAFALGAELGLTPGDEIASGIATRVSAEVQPGHVGDVEVDPDGAGATAGVLKSESSGSGDGIGGDFVDVDAIHTSRVLTGLASISDTDGSLEVVVLALKTDLECGVFSVHVRRESDGSRPGGAVHVELSLVVDGVGTSGGGNTKSCDERADFRGVVGSVEVADGGVGSAVSVVLLLFTGLDAELFVGVPQAVAVSLAGVLGVVDDTARAIASGDAPVAGSVRVTVSFCGVLTLGFALTLGSEEAAVVFSALLSRPVTSRAGIHARFVFILASGIASADGVVGDAVALAEAELTGKIPLTLFAVVSFPAGAVVDVGEPFAAELAGLSGVVPEALGGAGAVSHHGTARAVGLAGVVVVPDAVDIGSALLLVPLTERTVGDALATFPIALRRFCALAFLRRSPSDLAAFIAALVGSVPHAEFVFLQTALVGSSAEVASEAADVVVEEVALLVFGLGRAGGVFDEDGAVHAAVILTNIPVALVVSVTLVSTGVATTVAAELALAGAGAVGDPGAVSGVTARSNGGVGVAGRTADGIDGIPDAFAASVRLVVAIAGGGVSGADSAAFAGALEFEDHVTEQVAVGHILDVESHDACRGDGVAVGVRVGARDTSREGRPVQDVGGVGVEVRASTSGRISGSLEWSLDAVVGGALGLGVAGEESELNVDVTLAAGDRLVEFCDLAAGVVGAEVVDGDVVQTEEAHINSAVEVLSPDAVARGVVTASVLGVEVALLLAALLFRPVPVAILVEVAVGLSLVLPNTLSVADLEIGVPLAASEVETGVLGGEDGALFVTLAGGSLPCAGIVVLALGLSGVVAALAGAVTLGVVVGVEDPAAADVIQALVGVEVAADLGHAVVTTVVPFAISISLALGFVGVVTGAVGAVEIADEGGQALLDVAHGVRVAVRLVECLERGTGAGALLGVGPLVPDAASVLTSSALAGGLREVRVFATAEAGLVSGECGVRLELAVLIHVTSSFVGGIGGADASAAVVDTVPGAAAGVLGENVGGAAGFAVVTELAVFEALAGSGVPVALDVAEAETGVGVVALHAAALAFEVLAFVGNGVTFGLSVRGVANNDLAGVAPCGPLTHFVGETFINITVQARADLAAAGSGGGRQQAVGVHLTVNASGGRISALAFLAGRIGIGTGGLGVPAAEVARQAGVLVVDEAVAGTALGGSIGVPDAGSVSDAVVLVGVLADLADAGVGSGDVLALGLSGAAGGVVAVGGAIGFLTHTLSESVAVGGRALGNTLDELAVLALDTSADELFRDFLAAHLPAAGGRDTLGDTGLVVLAVSVGVADAVGEAVARENSVGVDGILGGQDGGDEVEGVAHAVQEDLIEVVDTNGLEEGGGRIVDELVEGDEGGLLDVESGTDDIDTPALELLNDGGRFPTDLAGGDEDDDLLAVAGEFVEHGLGLGDGAVDDHEVGGVDVVAHPLEFGGQGGVDVGELAGAALVLVVTSLEDTDTETVGCGVSAEEEAGPGSGLCPAVDHGGDTGERVHLAAHGLGHDFGGVDDEDDIGVVARSEATVTAVGGVPVAVVVLVAVA